MLIEELVQTMKQWINNSKNISYHSNNTYNIGMDHIRLEIYYYYKNTPYTVSTLIDNRYYTPKYFSELRTTLKQRINIVIKQNKLNLNLLLC